MRAFFRRRKPATAPPQEQAYDCQACGAKLPAETLKCIECGSVRDRNLPPAPTFSGLR